MWGRARRGTAAPVAGPVPQVSRPCQPALAGTRTPLWRLPSHLLQARHVAIVSLGHQLRGFDPGQGRQVLQHRHVHGRGDFLDVEPEPSELGPGGPPPSGHAASPRRGRRLDKGKVGCGR